MSDKIKWILAVLVLVGAVWGFYQLADQSLLLRVGLMLVALVVSALTVKSTELGVRALDFTRGSIVEVRKVVWPTRQEAIQTTIMVMVMVVIAGFIIWIFDWGLGWVVRLLTGQGG